MLSPKQQISLLALGTVSCLAAALYLFERQIRKTVEVETGEAADKAWERVTDKVPVPDGVSETT